MHHDQWCSNFLFGVESSSSQLQCTIFSGKRIAFGRPNLAPKRSVERYDNSPYNRAKAEQSSHDGNQSFFSVWHVLLCHNLLFFVVPDPNSPGSASERRWGLSYLGNLSRISSNRFLSPENIFSEERIVR